MSDPARDDEMVISTLRRMNAETGKFIEEQQKLIAEERKLRAEERKLRAEADKFGRERLTLVVSSTAVATLAIAAIGGLIVKLMGW